MSTGVVDDKASDPNSSINISWPQLPQRPIWLNPANKNKGNEHSKKDPTSGNTSASASASKTSSYSITLLDEDKAPEVHSSGCEYLDHTADVQLHAWGSSRAEAYAASVVGLHSYMIDAPDVQATHSGSFEAAGHDEHSLLFAVLDEALFMFASEAFVITRASVELLHSNVKEELNKDRQSDNLLVRVGVWGYYFQQGVHQQGTEVKAITYSNMQVVDKTSANNGGTGDGFHLYVIVDI